MPPVSTSHPPFHKRSDALERYGVLNVQWQQLEEELRPLLKHYVAHPISVNQSNAHVLPILLASKALPEMEARDAELLEGLHAATGTSGLPPEQQLALIMVRGLHGRRLQGLMRWERGSGCVPAHWPPMSQSLSSMEHALSTQPKVSAFTVPSAPCDTM